MFFHALAALLPLVSAAPLPGKGKGSKHVSPVKDLVTDAPHFVAYSQNAAPDAATFAATGFTTLALAFWNPSAQTGPSTAAAAWAALDSATKQSTKQAYADAGVNVIVAAFGEGPTPTYSQWDPVATADELAQFVKDNDLDGVDVDYEDFSAIWDDSMGGAVDWLVSFQNELRAQLPQGQYIITHAPVAPWMTTNTGSFPNGNYLSFHQQAGDTVDWYNLQFYNQQDINLYGDCATMLNTDVSGWEGANLAGMIANGIPADKLVMGKPVTAADAPSGGYIDPATLNGCVSQAKALPWNGGLSIWQEGSSGWDSWVGTVWGA